MKKVIVVTGASSGFGALTARALAKAGHVVYTSMRDTSGRNKGQVQAAARFAADHKADLRTVELDVLSDTSANAAITKVRARTQPQENRKRQIHSRALNADPDIPILKQAKAEYGTPR